MKRALHWAGTLLCLAAVALFVREARQTGLHLPEGGVWQAVLWIGALGLAYAAAVGLLAWLWTLLVLDRGTARGVRLDVAASYLVSQFGKYLPGNVFQYVGRHVLGRRLGIGHAVLASAAVLEAGFLVATTSLAVAFFAGGLLDGWPWARSAAAAVGLAGLAVILASPRVFPGIVPLRWLDPARVSLAFAGYAGFVTVFGVLYFACLRLYEVPAPLLDAFGFAALGWLAGFLVPGAPAGAGLREATLALVSPGQPSITSAIIAFRLVTMLGDVLAFLAGLALQQMQGRDRSSTISSAFPPEAGGHKDAT